MKIKPKSSLLVVSPEEGTELAVDMYISKDDEDKNLITCKVNSWTWDYKKWDRVITGKYSLYKLVYKGEDYFFLEREDVIGTIE